MVIPTLLHIHAPPDTAMSASALRLSAPEWNPSRSSLQKAAAEQKKRIIETLHLAVGIRERWQLDRFPTQVALNFADENEEAALAYMLLVGDASMILEMRSCGMLQSIANVIACLADLFMSGNFDIRDTSIPLHELLPHATSDELSDAIETLLQVHSLAKVLDDSTWGPFQSQIMSVLADLDDRSCRSCEAVC